MKDKKLSIGFIGAGRVGHTLGRYFFEKNLNISGFFSKTYDHACQAAAFTHSNPYKTIKELAEDSQIIFITVPDSEIYNVFTQLKVCELKDKILCHCSGSLSSEIFQGIELTGAHGYSVHPIFAISDKKNSYREISNAFFTVEGSKERMHVIEEIFLALGNPIQIIDAKDKHKYHAAAVMASNLVIGLYHMAATLLEECGFSESVSEDVLAPLFLNNAESLCRRGCLDSLTGPIDRNDVNTVRDHLAVLKHREPEFTAYRALSKELIKIAEQKYTDRDYEELKNIMD